MGESLLAILFEGGTILLLPPSQVSLGRLYLGTLFGIAISFSFKLFYADIDNQVLRRGTHAIRWHRNAGLVWSLAHFFFHVALILSATGLGLALRGAAVRPSVEADAASSVRPADQLSHSAVAAAAAAAPLAGADNTPDGGAATAQVLLSAFDGTSRWVFASGTFGALLILVFLSLAHKPGPRAATRTWRLLFRTVVSVAALVGLSHVPPAYLGGLGLLGGVAGIVTALALGEYVLLECDRIGWFRSELTRGVPGGDLRGEGWEEEEDWDGRPLPGGSPLGSACVDGDGDRWGGEGGGSAAPAALTDWTQVGVEGGAADGPAADAEVVGDTRPDAGAPPPGPAGAPRVLCTDPSAKASPGGTDEATDGGEDGGELAQPPLSAACRRARFWVGGDGGLTVSGVKYRTYDAAGKGGGCEPAPFF